MHPKSPCIFVVAPISKLLEIRYALRLVVFPCQYLPSTSSSFQLILPSTLYHISYVSILHLLCRRIHLCCLTSPPPCSSSAVFTAEFVCHPHYPGVTIRPQVGGRFLSIFSQSLPVLPTHFAISVVPHLIYCRPKSPPPLYPSLLSRISITVLIRASIVILLRLYCSPYHTNFNSSV